MSQDIRSRHELDAVFADLEHRFGTASREITEYDTGIKEQITHLKEAFTGKSVTGSLRKDHPLLAYYAAFRHHMEKECAQWLENLERNHTNQCFRNKFNENMLVYVYGKVKTAKSSLGNFLAYGRHNPTPEDIKTLPPVHFDVEQISDCDAEAAQKLEKQRTATRRDRKFRVDFLEATACIQYFKKPGFTWVDSPGIHSTTSQNGQLAMAYLESADLVVYAISSRASERESDRDQITKILQSGKKLLIVCTKCDEIIKDEDPETGELVSCCSMSSPEDRNDIKRGCISAIVDDMGREAWAGLGDELAKNVITLSVHYAEQHPEEPGWSESGLPEFFSVLGAVARSEGVRLKLQAPLRTIINNIRQMQEALEGIRQKQSDIQSNIQKTRSALAHQVKSLSLTSGQQLEHEIMELSKRYVGNDEEFKKHITDVAAKALEEATRQLAKTVVNDTAALTEALRPNGFSTENLPAYEDIYQTITYHSTSRKRKGTLFGAVMGAAVGFLAGGPAGAAIGAGIGSAGGGVIGGTMDGSNTSKVKVGDNTLEVGRAAARKARAWFEQALAHIHAGMDSTCMLPLQQWLDETQKDLDSFSRFLIDKRTELEQELNS